jgi:cell division protein FtsI (penicillin-binding protein 3)
MSLKSKSKTKTKSKTKLRSLFIYTIFLIFLILTIYRLLSLQYFKFNFYDQEGKKRHLKITPTLPIRGDILDRNNTILATDTRIYNLILNPKNINIQKLNNNDLLTILKITNNNNSQNIDKFKNYLNKLKKQNIKYKIFAKNLTPKQMQKIKKIKKINLTGFEFEEKLKRFYPAGKSASTMLGSINYDRNGVEGAELKYNKALLGTPGKKTQIKSRDGKIIDTKQHLFAKDGLPIQLTIDKNIQYLTYKALKDASIKHKANSASAIIMDVNTGEIFAMTNYPGFNPNNLSDNNNHKNLAISDLFEPGSTIKPFAITSALISKKYTPNTIIKTSPGIYKIGKNKIQDIRNFGDLSVTEVLKKSSNIGAAKIILDLNNPNVLPNLLKSLKFGEKSKLYLTGESKGYIPINKRMGKFPLATLAFGYGLNCNLLQLTTAYAILANNGNLVTPRIDFNNNINNISQNIIPENISKQILNMLTTVTEPGGTATRARIKGFKVAGKTGTSKVAIKGGYAKDRYQSLFIGIAPMPNPKYVMAILINEPSGKYYYGGTVAAPVFSKVMSVLLAKTITK